MAIGWSSSDETPCGKGSEKEYSKKIIAVLRSVVREYEIESLSDAGAGDLNWIDDAKLSLTYTPYDLIVRDNRVTQFDITSQVLPTTDLILCRHVLNHLSANLARAAVQNFYESESKYLLVTNFEGQQEYWKSHDLNIAHMGWELITMYDDCTKWWLELYRRKDG